LGALKEHFALRRSRAQIGNSKPPVPEKTLRRFNREKTIVPKKKTRPLRGASSRG
jgi:hypothetical protein